MATVHLLSTFSILFAAPYHSSKNWNGQMNTRTLGSSPVFRRYRRIELEPWHLCSSYFQTISKAVEQYCRSVEELFMTEMFPRPSEYLQPQKSSAWLEKAKQLTTASEKKVEPFNFRPESCVKLNNVESARKLLDNMYNQMQVDKITDALAASPPVPEKVERPRFLFTVKIVMAEDLVPLDSNSSAQLDTFVTLSDEAGNRLVKTRTIYETVNPRCEIYSLRYFNYSDLQL